MYDTSVSLNLSKLNQYEFSFLDDFTRSTNDSLKVILELDYQTKESFDHLEMKLKSVLEKSSLTDHYNELLYLIMIKNEQMRIRYDAYWMNYNDDLTSKEVASFLLAYKESKPNEHVQLAIKPTLNATASIKDTTIAKWMCQVLFDKIENRDFPLGVFGEKILYDLFGQEFSNTTPIDLDKLKVTATRSVRKPTKMVNKLKVEFCQFLQPYLNENTELNLPDDVMLTDAQANFFFNLLEMLGYHKEDDFDSEPKDYIHSIFRNALTSK